MPEIKLDMPLAVVPVGTDPATYYASFSGKLTPSWSPSEGLVVWVAAENEISGLYAPIKAAMRFAPAGTTIGDTTLATDSILLQTWPTTYITLKRAFPSPVPSEIRIENVDAAVVRTMVSVLFAALGRTTAAVDGFMRGEGLLKVDAGAPIGTAAAATGAPSPTTPNKVKIVMSDAAGNSLNPIQFLSDASDHAGIDSTQHPLLSELDLDGWVEVLVVDASGTPLSGEPYDMYLADGTTRHGNTDASGRIYETGIPIGEWALDLTNHPSFEMLE